MRIDVAIRGPLFDKKVDAVVKSAIVAEVFAKVDERMERSARATTSKGRRLRANPKNTVTRRHSGLTYEASSTLRSARTVGTAWVQKHIGASGYGKGILGAMLPNVLRKTAQRITSELS